MFLCGWAVSPERARRKTLANDHFLPISASPLRNIFDLCNLSDKTSGKLLFLLNSASAIEFQHSPNEIPCKDLSMCARVSKHTSKLYKAENKNS